MASAAWLRRRARWFREHRQRTDTDTDPACAVCGTCDGLELHHHEYTRLGHEDYDDLTPLCQLHHRRLHDVYDASKQWRSIGRRAASVGIIAAMRHA